MDQMHDELLKLEGQSSSLNGSKSSLVSSGEDDEWETVGPKNKSAVTRTQSFVPSELSGIFGGQLRSLVRAKGKKYNYVPSCCINILVRAKGKKYSCDSELFTFFLPQSSFPSLLILIISTGKRTWKRKNKYIK